MPAIKRARVRCCPADRGYSRNRCGGGHGVNHIVHVVLTVAAERGVAVFDRRPGQFRTMARSTTSIRAAQAVKTAENGLRRIALLARPSSASAGPYETSGKPVSGPVQMRSTSASNRGVSHPLGATERSYKILHRLLLKIRMPPKGGMDFIPLSGTNRYRLRRCVKNRAEQLLRFAEPAASPIGPEGYGIHHDALRQQRNRNKRSLEARTRLTSKVECGSITRVVALSRL